MKLSLVRLFLYLLFILSVFAILWLTERASWASGVGRIITEENGDISWDNVSESEDDFSEPFEVGESDPNFQDYDNDGYDQTISGNGGYSDDSSYDGINPYYKIVLNIQAMREAISENAGQAEANYLVLLLFALAALLQMARIGQGGGDWIAFTIRVILVLSFLCCFPKLYDGVELFFNHLSDQILGGESAYETFWMNQEMVQGQLSAAVDANKSWFSINSLVYIAVLFSFVVSFAIYVLIYLSQACILIVLQYLGPILIALALIPETNFTGGYISTLFMTESWTVIIAILLKIMSTATEIGAFQQIGMPDFLAISAMNICYAFSFFTVPLSAGLIFSGKGLGGLGSSLGMLAKGAASYMTGKMRGWMFSSGKYLGGKAVSAIDTAYDKGTKWASAIGRNASHLASRELRRATAPVREKLASATDHIRKITPAGRAYFNHKHYPNAGYGNFTESNSASNKFKKEEADA